MFCYKYLQVPGPLQHSSEGGRLGLHRQGTPNLLGKQVLVKNYRTDISIHEPKKKFMGLKPDGQDWNPKSATS